MAKVIKGKFDFYPPGLRKHDWNKWLDGQIWKLEKDVDFAGLTKNFRTAVYHEAAKRQIQIMTRIMDDGKSIVIQAQHVNQHST